jgi:hypothetical protein
MHLSQSSTLPEVYSHDIFLDFAHPDQAHDLVRYSAKRRLPIDGWCVWGSGQLPRPREYIAQWLSGLVKASHVPVSLMTCDLQEHHLHRLEAHLARCGCKLMQE